MSVVNKAVEHGVGDGGIADDLVPVIDRHLAGDDGRAAFVAIVHDFQQIAALLAGERGETPIVENEEIDPCERLEQPGIAAVAAGERQCLEQPRNPMVEDRTIVATSLVAERAGDPSLADPGRADDQQVMLAVDPVAGGELGEEGAVEASRGPQIDVLDDGRLPQGGEIQAGHESSVLALGDLAIDQEANRSSKASASMSGWRS